MSAGTILSVRDLKKHFPIQKGYLRKVVGHVYAVDGVSFTVAEGETLGIVGESGSGKTTVGRCINRLLHPTAGSIEFARNDVPLDVASLSREQLKRVRRDIQMVFQDPNSSLNPRMRVGQIVTEPLVIHNIGTPRERADRAAELLERVGLRPEHINRFPHQFSGGQRQRIGIARALAVKPRLIICDEPVSALDVSVQAQVLNLLRDVQADFGLTYLFIAHNLAVVQYASDRIMVMYLGKACELASANAIYTDPRHPYTEALLSAIPKDQPDSKRRRIILPGTIPDPSKPPTGCRFHTRCPYAVDRCREQEPDLEPVSDDPGRLVACHRTDELSLSGYVE
jgi:oligopeptide/dipeptide ABC transporter ATP-binding protein